VKPASNPADDIAQPGDGLRPGKGDGHAPEKNFFPPPMRRKPVISRLFQTPAGLSENNYI